MRRFCLAVLVAMALAVLRPPAVVAEECARAPLTQTQIAEAIAEDLKSVPAEQARDTRYLTLAASLNTCAGEADMQVYRHAVAKLLNSLSWAPKPARIETVDENKAILRFRLSELAWSDTEWDRLLLIYPYGLKPDTPAFADIAARTGTTLPYLRGDWFTATASRPPHYYRILKLPGSFKTLQKKLGEEAAATIRTYYGRKGSGYRSVDEGNRIRLEPKQIFTDIPPEKKQATNKSNDFPTGLNVRRAPRSIPSITHFTLPNGFRGYFLHHAIGARVDRHRKLPCPECNFAHLTEVHDEDAGTVTLMSSGRYQVSPANDATIRGDEKRWHEAMQSVGLDPALDGTSGLEPIQALTRAFESARITMASAAAELGMAPDTMEQNLLTSGDDGFHTARVLAQQAYSRQRFQSRFRAIAGNAGGPGVLPNEKVGKYISLASRSTGGLWRRRTGTFELTLVSERSEYRRGDLLKLSVRPQLSCNLTLIGIAADNSATVLFPNRYNQETYIHANRIKTLPGKAASFRFRLNETGTEQIVAYCNAHTRWSGLKHDFGEVPFTRIADFAAYEKKRKDWTRARKKASSFGFAPLIANSKIEFQVE